MTWRIGAALLALPLALPLPAGAADEAARVAEAERAVAELVKSYGAAEEAMQERLAAMREGEEFKKAREAEDFEKLKTMSEAIRGPFLEEWRQKFADAAAAFDGSEGEVLFAAATLEKWLILDPAPLILATLGEHPRSGRIAPILDASPRIARSDRKGELRSILGKVIAENPDTTIRAHAHFARAQATAYDKEATEEQKAEAEADLLGKTLRLSDFRGKVVMLDFWGDW
jgi:hypothetical protein